MIFLTRCVLHGAGFTRLFVGSLTLVVARWCAAFVLSGTATLSIVAQETPCPPTVVWQTSFGGDSLETGVQIAPTSDGGCVIVGYSDSGQSGNKSSPTFGKNDIWVVRIDGNGDKLWERALGGSGQDYFNAVCATSDGGYLIGGGSDSPADGNKDSPNLGNSDFWLIRLDPQGDKIWERTYGGRGSEALGTITAAPDGGFLLAGESFTSGVEANFGFGRYDIWIVRIDANGEELWDRYLGGSQDEWLGTIPIGSADGGYLLVINSDSPISGNKTAPNFGAPDIWLVKLDATGRILWDKTYGGTDADYGSAVVERSDGSIVLGGSSFSAPSGNKTSPLFGLDDIWLVELDSHGEKVWERTYGGAGEDGLSDMVLMPDSGLLLYGSSDSMDGDRSSPGFGLGDWWLVRVGPTGKKQWDLSIGGDGYDFAATIRRAADGGFILGGTSWSTPSGSKTSPFFGGIDWWVVKLSAEPACEIDRDGDGIPDARDECPNTPAGSIVNKNGCSIEDLAPCDGPWRNHRAYVRAVSDAATKFVKEGLISHRIAIRLIAHAETSNCGRKEPHRPGEAPHGH